jgi:RNA polymerase sigma-70 factor (ECF subfamily)
MSRAFDISDVTVSQRSAITPSAAAALATVVVAPRASRDFEDLYAANFDFVFRCLRRLGVRVASVEDACQDTFIVLHRRFADLRPDASERAFLFAVATRVAREYRRKQARTQTVALPDELPASAFAATPFDAAANAQALAHVERFLATLDQDQRSVFMLMELEDFSAPEVCEALAAPLNTIYSRLRLARARFMRFLREEGLQS